MSRNTNEEFKQSLNKIKNNNNSSEDKKNITEHSEKPSAPNKTQLYVDLFKNLKKTEDETTNKHETPKPE